MIFTRCFCLLLCLCILGACGGGSSDNGSSVSGSNESGSGEGEGRATNGSGFVYYADSNRIIQHNVDTGEMRWHVNTYFNGESANASKDGSLFAVFDIHYKTLDIFEPDSNQVLRLEAHSSEKFREPVVISPNNQFFMLYIYEDMGFVDAREGLVIYDMNKNKRAFFEW